MGAAVVPTTPKASQPGASPNAVILQVTGGAHSGVVLPIERSECRIGASSKSDIVLSDRGVADDHATLRIDRGRLLIEARGGEVSLGDGQVVPKGQGARVKLPVEIRVGSSALRLTGGPETPFWLQPPLAAVACVALLLIGSIAATQAGLISGGSSSARVVEPGPAALAAVAPATDPISALRERLAVKGVEGLKVEASGDRVVVRGAIDDARRSDWASAQRWFDETYGGRYVLASEVGAKSAMSQPRFQLQAIWFGPSPYVVTADGQRRYPGATLGDGWVLKDVREGRITVAKADQEVALSY